jgi:hypothetical protein
MAWWDALTLPQVLLVLGLLFLGLLFVVARAWFENQ